MLETTIQIIRSGLKTDPSLTSGDRARIIKFIRSGLKTTKGEAVPTSEPRLIRRAETARRLACSLRTVDKLAASGILQKRKLPGRVRASGFLVSDVDALILASEPGLPQVPGQSCNGE